MLYRATCRSRVRDTAHSICGVTHSYVCVTWRIHMWDVTRWCVWHDSTYWCVCEMLMCLYDILVCVWHIDVCLTYWCVFDILMCVRHIDVCLTFWCVFDMLVCVWHIGACVTYWCVRDILMCVWHVDVCVTYWCVWNILMCVRHIDVCVTCLVIVKHRRELHAPHVLYQHCVTHACYTTRYRFMYMSLKHCDAVTVPKP